VPEYLTPEPAQVDALVSLWRQGDFIVGGDCWFAFHDLDEAGVQIMESAVHGLVVTTQTCDIVRNVADRPWIEVSPLVEVTDDELAQIQQGNVIQYAVLPFLIPRRLVVDLDRSMTVHKRVVATWERCASGLDDIAGRLFSQALARKRARKAFPNDFVKLVGKLRDFVKSKHGKDSPDGRALLDLREIRVTAAPNWTAEEVSLRFWFVWNEWTLLDRDSRAATAGRWCAKVVATNRFRSVSHAGVLLCDMRADEYVNSDALDLDYLSSSNS
jgi:hypothetical protein